MMNGLKRNGGVGEEEEEEEERGRGAVNGGKKTV